MPGKWVTNKQVDLYMKSRNEGCNQVLSAAKSGISERTGRSIDTGNRTAPQTKQRRWKTKKDPFFEVWSTELEPLLEESPSLQAITLLEYLQSQYPGKYPDSKLRTLQRRVKQWQALHGPEKEVIFRQEHPVGLMGLSDFTTLKNVQITIQGRLFKHILYHFRLSFSHWSYLKVIQGGESYTALAEGLQEALYRLGGSPLEHRTDSLSAAYKNLSKDESEDITIRYTALCAHFSMKATRNNRGASHENGSVESPHGHIKRRITQALLLRGSNDFSTVSEYQAFIEEVAQGHNRRNAKSVGIEREHLQKLPANRGTDYTELSAVVTSSSSICVRCVVYTVPSRLSGEVLRIRLYDDRLCCYLGCKWVITLERHYPKSGQRRARSVDYKHVIKSLVKKPQAFRYSQIREDLLPTKDYHTIWQHVNSTMQPRDACKFIVGLLSLAAVEDCEQALSDRVLKLIAQEQSLSLQSLQTQFSTKHVIAPPVVLVTQHGLADYDSLLNRTVEEQSYA